MNRKWDAIAIITAFLILIFSFIILGHQKEALLQENQKLKADLERCK